MSFELHHGDCLELMRSIPDGSIDCVLTDPPYGDTSLSWDRRVPAWQAETRRVLNGSGSVWFFTSLRHLLAMDLTGWKVAQELIWEKHNGSNFHADRFRRVHEFIVQIYPDDVAWLAVYKQPVTTPDATARTVRRKQRPPHTGHINAGAYESFDGGPRLQRSVIHARSCHGYAQHPTQKPLEILHPLIEYSCPIGGTILDPFMGSGSTGAACELENRNFIGIEKDEGYFNIAKERIKGVEKREPLFMGRAS